MGRCKHSHPHAQNYHSPFDLVIRLVKILSSAKNWIIEVSQGIYTKHLKANTTTKTKT